ncbi:MAG: hypothetical protein JWP87_6168 [Labilithrix sp.]|nr:hypothetical protein [Labilithrix sp.]
MFAMTHRRSWKGLVALLFIALTVAVLSAARAPATSDERDRLGSVADAKAKGRAPPPEAKQDQDRPRRHPARTPLPTEIWKQMPRGSVRD